MRMDKMPSARFTPNGSALVREAYKAINFAQVQYDLTKGASEAPAALRKFFEDCAKQVPVKTITKEAE